MKTLAIVGATGLVGRKMIEVIQEQVIPYDRLILLASRRSKGKIILVNGKELSVQELNETFISSTFVDYALFSAGSDVSKKYVPLFIRQGTVVIDNSSFWRMKKNVPLVVPEVNGEELKNHQGIIANPNCSTIQMVMALKPLHDAYVARRVVVSTYQSVTGSGKNAVEQLFSEVKGKKSVLFYPHQIFMNAIPHIDIFLEDGFSREEWKIIEETKKIISSDIDITATSVRIPTVGGHSESINIEFKKSFELDDVRKKLTLFPGVMVEDNPQRNVYPMPVSSHEKDAVFVGRIRRDKTVTNGLHLWVVSDNLRKGAATNAVQILRRLLK